MENFILKVNSVYRDLKSGTLINIKRVEDSQFIITLNKGKKEYSVPKNYLNYLRILSENNITMESLFENPEKSYCIGMYGVKNHINNFTALGIQLYESHYDAENFIQKLSHE